MAERFWLKVDRAETGCWLWLASTSSSGYGQIVTTTKAGKRLKRAHRVAWELTRGPIPEGLYVLHRCDNPPCVRPDHLMLGTHQDNVADMMAKGRHGHGVTSLAGERNGNAKITAEIVTEIRRRRAQGESVRSVAASTGLSPAQVSRITTGKRWRHVPAGN